MEIGNIVVLTVALIVVGGAVGASYHPGPAKPQEGALNFLVVGDWGGQSDNPHYTEGEASVAIQMGITAEQIGSQFTIALGDNFYDNGVTDVEDPRFKETFEVSRVLACSIPLLLRASIYNP